MRTRRVSRQATVFGLGALGVAILGTGPAAAQDADPSSIKVAIVDLEAVAAGSPAGRALQERLNDFQRQVRVEEAPLLARRNEINQEIANAPDSLTADQQGRLAASYQAALTTHTTFTQNKGREAQEIRAEGLSEVQAQVRPVLEAIQREMGLDLILNQNSPAVVLISDRINITQLVLDRLGAISPSEG